MVGRDCSGSVVVAPVAAAVPVAVAPPALAVVAEAAGDGVGSPAAISTGASGGIVPVT